MSPDPKAIERIHFPSVDLTGLEAIARWITDCLEPPLSVGLIGTLGAGKTRLVQVITDITSSSKAEATSPTFTLLQTYEGAPRIHHLDAYRVADEDEFLELGVEELFDDAQAFTLVEWADRVASVMPLETLWIELHEGERQDVRQITVRCRNASVMQRLREAARALPTSVSPSPP